MEVHVPGAGGGHGEDGVEGPVRVEVPQGGPELAARGRQEEAAWVDVVGADEAVVVDVEAVGVEIGQVQRW